MSNTTLPTVRQNLASFRPVQKVSFELNKVINLQGALTLIYFDPNRGVIAGFFPCTHKFIDPCVK